MKKRTRLFLASLALLLSACTMSKPPAYDLPSADGLVKGEEVTVRRGDNLYTIAQKNGVRLRDLIVVNEMTPPYHVKPGDTIYLPAKDKYAAPTPKSAPLDYIDKGYMRPSTASADGVTDHTVTLSGGAGVDSVQAVPLESPKQASRAAPAVQAATPHSVKTTYTNVPKVGESVPEPSSVQPAPAPSPSSSAAPSALQSEEQAEIAAAASQHSPFGGGKPRATTDAGEMAVSDLGIGGKSEAPPAAAPTQQAASSTASPSDVPAFAWPVRGTIISAFGPKGQGRDNDGLNIAAPKGSPVKAADGGMVAYAGNEMKGFGNLVLIRHEGGWVTAYAHMDRIVVSKDNVVAKGDMIGTVGTTGGVGSPQLHFEARQDGKPVDPELVLK